MRFCSITRPIARIALRSPIGDFRTADRARMAAGETVEGEVANAALDAETWAITADRTILTQDREERSGMGCRADITGVPVFRRRGRSDRLAASNRDLIADRNFPRRGRNGRLATR